MPVRSSGRRSKRIAVEYLRHNFDEAAILAVALKIAFEEQPELSEPELAVVAAMQRANPGAGTDIESLGEWVAGLDPEQVAGVVSNTKGVLHEMEFVRLENEDGDSTYAALFDDSNHKVTDVQFMDEASGEVWEVQLKATDSASYVQDWIDDHPDGEILVTDELAQKMGIESSGLSNEELTARTRDVVDRMIESTEDDDMWDFFPALSAVSLGLVAWELWGRYKQGEISIQRFKAMMVRATGLKIGKIALLSLAMAVPGLNVVTGALLAAKLIHSAASS